MVSRATTQIAFSNFLCFPVFFPMRPQIFPVPIYVICEYWPYLHKTYLADLSTIKKIFISFAENIEYLLPYSIREFKT